MNGAVIRLREEQVAAAADPEQTLGSIQRNHGCPLPLQPQPGERASLGYQISRKRGLRPGRGSGQGQYQKCPDGSYSTGHRLFLSGANDFIPIPTRVNTYP